MDSVSSAFSRLNQEPLDMESAQSPAMGIESLDLESAVHSRARLEYEAPLENNGTSPATESRENHNNHHHVIDVGHVLPETSQTSGTGQASTPTATENAAAGNTSPASMVESKEAVKSPPGGVCKQTDGNHGHSDPTATAARSEITDMLSDHDHDGAMHVEGRQKPKWIIEMMEPESNKENLNRLQKLQKVPSTLRQVESNKKYYDPLLVAIGPYNLDRKGHLEQMENLKIQFAKQYSADCKKDVWELYHKVEKQLVNAKNYYEDSVKNIEDELFAKMMFLDACFVIQIIFKDGCSLVTTNELTYIIQDIFLLENQLPYAILTALMELSPIDGQERKRKIDDVVKFAISDIMEDVPKEINEGKDKDYTSMHLLHLVHKKLIGDNQKQEGSSASYSRSDRYSDRYLSYRSLKELKSVGIHIGPSDSGRLSDITFKSGYWSGCLRIPPMTIGDGTKYVLLNLVAYETSMDKDLGVTSYLEFMDLLIDHAEDVKELRSNGVIRNPLTSDEEVAKLFNEITDKVVFSSESFMDVKKSIQQYYKSRRRFWLAECLHTHFGSPWSIIAFLAATVLLLLTLAQTIFSGLQI